jgi:hypothetical protein
VRDCAGLVVPTDWLAKFRLVADQVASGPEVSPTPLRETECGLPTVLSVMVIEAVRGPNWLAVRVTLMVQFAPAARLEPHELLWLKSVALVPVTAMRLIITAEVPVLVTVSACAPLRVSTNCGAKLRLAGERVRVSGSRRIETV